MRAGGFGSMWPFRHFGLKVLSLGLALLLWVTVAGEQTVERSLRVPLEFQQFPTGLELQGDVPATIDVRVRGTSGSLSRVAPGDVVAVLDLRGARPGQRLFHLGPDQVRAPFGIQVLQAMPPSIAMTFDTSASKSVPIVPPLDGRPAPGFIVSKWTCGPAFGRGRRPGLGGGARHRSGHRAGQRRRCARAGPRKRHRGPHRSVAAAENAAYGRRFGPDCACAA